VIAMGSPTIDVNGLDVPGIVNMISALPNMPPELIAQLKNADLQHTLIIPVTDQQTVKNGTINGARSTTISQKDDSMSVVLWITSDNVMHIAIGTYGANEMEQSPIAPYELPEVIVIYQENIEAICRTDDDIVDEIRKTVIHEVGHHFGLSDDAMEALENE